MKEWAGAVRTKRFKGQVIRMHELSGMGFDKYTDFDSFSGFIYFDRFSVFTDSDRLAGSQILTGFAGLQI